MVCGMEVLTYCEMGLSDVGEGPAKTRMRFMTTKKVLTYPDGE
jgi:hypothetical protein